MSRVSEILMERGRNAAQARAASGAIRGQSVAALGALPGQIMNDRAQQAFADRKAAQEAEAQQFARNRDQRETASAAGIDVERAARLEQMHKDQAEKEADKLRASGATANDVKSWVTRNIGTYFLPDEADDLLAQIDQPDGHVKLLDRFAPVRQPKVAEPFTLGENEIRFGPDGKRIAEGPKKVEKPPAAPNVGSFEDYVMRKYGPTPTPTQIESARKTYAEAGSTKDPAVTRYQSKDVLNDDGKPVMANYDAVSGRYTDPVTGQPIKNPKPVPSMQEMMDSRKFAKAAPVLSSLSELSEKINTQQGAMAKISGGAARLAAKANYDDDVAEYEAIVAMFTPMVARALGHTGVLTELDVESVKTGFPKPGDSKTLRDRKMARLMSLVSGIEAASGGKEQPQSGPKVGEIVTYKGQKVRVTKVGANGELEGEPVK